MKKLMITLCLLLFCGCTQETEMQFYDQFASYEKEDGWIFYLIVEHTKTEAGWKKSFYFNGANLKYQTLDGYDVEQMDENGKVIGKGKGVLPLYLHNAEQKQELSALNSYFDQHQFQETITEAELDNLTLQCFKKDEIVTLYNEAMQDQRYQQGFGPYNIKESNCIQANLSDGSLLQLSYLNNYGYIQTVNIEYKKEDGTYLSDQNGENEIQAQKELDQLEQTIQNQQTWEISSIVSPEPSLQQEYQTALFRLLEEAFHPL